MSEWIQERLSWLYYIFAYMEAIHMDFANVNGVIIFSVGFFILYRWALLQIPSNHEEFGR